MRRLRGQIFVVWMAVTLTLYGGLGSPLLLLGRRGAMWVARGWIDAVFVGMRLILGLTFRVHGRIPDPPGLIACKHQSMFETLVLARLLERPVMIAKGELEGVPIFGACLKATGAIFVDREGGGRALRDLLKGAKKAREENGQVVIFPEGTRLAAGLRGEYKPGTAALYTALHAPCTPVAVNSGLFWPTKGPPTSGGEIIVSFLPAIEPGLDRDVFMARLEAAIEGECARLLNQAENASEGSTAYAL